MGARAGGPKEGEADVTTRALTRTCRHIRSCRTASRAVATARSGDRNPPSRAAWDANVAPAVPPAKGQHTAPRESVGPVQVRPTAGWVQGWTDA
jgi:hypothetical protein